ncbi:MAG: hypothetical protein NVS1B4_24450 [Gemmatimonadaceae bacterium]
MRILRQVALVATLATVAPTFASAQSGRLFKDSWFWGAKVGNSVYQTRTTRDRVAPLIGGEWLITRTHGALYVSLDQSFFSTTTTIDDPYSPNGQQPVRFKDNKRGTLALLAFPASIGILRPYAGLGLAINLIGEATATGGVAPGAQAQYIATELREQQSRAAPLVMVGLQAQLLRFSAFGQASYMRSRDRFLLNGRQTYYVETGIRWNFGSAIED